MRAASCKNLQMCKFFYYFRKNRESEFMQKNFTEMDMSTYAKFCVSAKMEKRNFCFSTLVHQDILTKSMKVKIRREKVGTNTTVKDWYNNGQ